MEYKFVSLKNKKDKTLRGVINFKGDFGEKKPTLIILPAHTEDRNGPMYLYRTIAEYFVEKDYYVVRFDYMGCGDSDGEFKEMTVSTQMSDTLEIFNFIREEGFSEKLYLFGHGLGGFVATLVAPEAKPDKMALLSPDIEVAKRMDDTIMYSINKIRPDAEEIDHQGQIMRHKDFYNDLLSKNAYESAKKYDGEVSIYRGSVDDKVGLEESDKLNDTFPRSNYVSIRSGNHDLNSTYWRGLMLDDMTEMFEADNEDEPIIF